MLARTIARCGPSDRYNKRQRVDGGEDDRMSTSLIHRRFQDTCSIESSREQSMEAIVKYIRHKSGTLRVQEAAIGVD